MHEFALAEAVVTAALQTAEREELKKITAINLRIGELQNIKRDVFEFALKEVLPREEPRLAETRFELIIEPARFRCRPCGHEFALEDTGGPGGADEQEAIHFVPELAHAFLRCPQCDSPDFELASGRGVMIESIEGE
jgi:hydrogenase nickel incorporation protein HypA/HybF